MCLEAQDSKKNYCNDPFQTVPGSIPGSCIPAFTGTRSGVVVQGFWKWVVSLVCTSQPLHSNLKCLALCGVL